MLSKIYNDRRSILLFHISLLFSLSLMQLWGSLAQSVLHLNRSQANQPMGGVVANPFSKLTTIGIMEVSRLMHRLNANNHCWKVKKWSLEHHQKVHFCIFKLPNLISRGQFILIVSHYYLNSWSLFAKQLFIIRCQLILLSIIWKVSCWFEYSKAYKS